MNLIKERNESVPTDSSKSTLIDKEVEVEKENPKKNDKNGDGNGNTTHDDDVGEEA